MQPSWLPIAIVSPIVAFAIYRRIVSLTTRQEVKRGTLIGRMVLLAVVAVALLSLNFSWLGLGASVGAAAVGVGLAIVSALQTTYAVENGVVYYVPFRWIGLVVSGLVVARIGYRFYEIATLGTAPAHYGPVTLAIFFLLAGYYVPYFAAVLRRAAALVRS